MVDIYSENVSNKYKLLTNRKGKHLAFDSQLVPFHVFKYPFMYNLSQDKGFKRTNISAL